MNAPVALPVRPIRPRPTSGRWRRIKDRVLIAVLVLLFLVPHLPWQRQGDAPQRAVLLDFVGGHAYVFGLVLGPRELPVLLAALIAAALLLFLTNSIVGRIWCGFACPQTLWTDLYRHLERRLGSPGRARAAWLLVSLATGYAMVSWFVPGGGLFGNPHSVATSFLLLFTALTYALAAHAQELVCTHMCPWPRIQAAMVDVDTRLVTYDEPRGEPRGPLKRRETAAKGACVDCGLCVAVCPMGIDIRQGQQLACIGCGLCADACDKVMARTGQPPGLIGFISQRAMEAPKVAAPALWRRPRPLAYAVLLLLVGGAAAAQFAARADVSIMINTDRNLGFVTLSDGAIRNVYTVSIRDSRTATDPLVLRVDGLPGADVRLSIAGAAPVAGGVIPAVAGSETVEARLLVTMPAGAMPAGRSPIKLVIGSSAGRRPLASADTFFTAPATVPQ